MQEGAAAAAAAAAGSAARRRRRQEEEAEAEAEGKCIVCWDPLRPRHTYVRRAPAWIHSDQSTP